MNDRNCEVTCNKDENGNCSIDGSDGLPIQCVGPWAEDKYFFLERYLNASCEARRKFADKGNAVILDLFSGPGKCIIKNDSREILSGGMRALTRDEAKFNESVCFDISESNVAALRERAKLVSSCQIICGDSNNLIEGVVRELLKKSYRYHFAFIDPFGPEGLKFKTIQELAKLPRLDILLHFPIGAIKRNLPAWKKSGGEILTNFLGTDSWINEIKKDSGDNVYRILIDIYKNQLKKIGFPEEGLKVAQSRSDIYAGLPTVSVKNTQNVDLYLLILASKHKVAQKIWSSIIKKSRDGQKELF